MRLLKTHSHTSERRGYEADQAHNVKRERKEGPSVRDRKKRPGKPYITWKGGVGEKRDDEKTKPYSSATTAAKGGGGGIIPPKRNNKSHSPVAQSEWKNKHPERPRPEWERLAERKRNEHEKYTVL